ncbi:hypothetical protein ACMA5I_13665 [Paracoccaceae bacterium GXU_MW_L88]
MSNQKIRSWTIHIGAHKTATTHFQDTLEAIRPQLERMEIDYLPRLHARGAIQEMLRRKNFRTYIRGPLMARQVNAVLAPLGTGAPHMVVSDENIIGFCESAIAHRPWPKLERTVGALASLRRDAELSFALSIRNFADVIAGCYAESLRYHDIAPEEFQKFCDEMEEHPLSWRPVIERISKVIANTPLRVWRIEDYSRDPGAIIAAFLNISRDTIEIPALAAPKRTKAPSRDAVREVEVAFHDPAYQEGWRDYVNAVFEQSPASETSAKFAPFSEAQHAALTQQYQDDLRWIEKNCPGYIRL